MSDSDAESKTAGSSAQIAPTDAANIEPLIHTVRGQQVMLDRDLAWLYEVETKNLNRAASRNADRFPADFRFQLTKEEDEALRCQIGTSNAGEGRGGRRYLPYAYTEQGIAMLSGVLRSEVAVQTSISIMRAFVAMRRFLAENAALLERLHGIEASQAALQRSTDERLGRGRGRGLRTGLRIGSRSPGEAIPRKTGARGRGRRQMLVKCNGWSWFGSIQWRRCSREGFNGDAELATAGRRRLGGTHGETGIEREQPCAA